MRIRILIALCSLLFLSTLAVGQNQTPAPTPTPQKSEWAEIETYAKSIEQFTKQNRRTRRMFADVAGENDKNEKWREFKIEKQMLDQEGVYDNAYVFWKDGKLVAAFLSFTSSSGDWYHFVDCYFRPDGTLAKIHARLNTFASENGGVSVVRERYYSKSGKLLHSAIHFYDLQSKKPRKRQNFMDMPIPVYQNVGELPFAKLLKS